MIAFALSCLSGAIGAWGPGGMTSEPALRWAIEACYDAALEPARWPAALQQLADFLDAASCVIRTTDDTHPFRFDQRNQPAATPDSTEHLEFTALWLERIDSAPDPHAERARRLRKSAPYFIAEDEITTPEERQRLPYYQEIARPGRREWRAIVGFKVKNRTWCLPTFREGKKGPFELQDAHRFLSIVPHFARILSAAEQLANRRADASLTTFEHVGCPALLLDSRGCVEKLNGRADALLGSDLVIRHGRIRAVDRSSDARLQGMIAAACSLAAGSAADPILITRNARPWLTAETMPLTAFAHDIFAAGHTLLILSEVERAFAPNETLLRQAFGLTNAEVRLAVMLARGIGIGDASGRLGIGRETARTQLRTIFEKTGTHSQAQLAALLSRFPAASRN